MTRLIIFEGPDGGGKTTAANRLASEIGGLEVNHTGPPMGDRTAYDQYLDRLAVEVSKHQPFSIFDRFHLGERVYGPLLRGVDTLGQTGQWDLERTMIDSADPVMVICLPPFRNVHVNWQGRRDHELLSYVEHLQFVYEFYQKARDVSILPIAYYDYTLDDWDTLKMSLV